jgi:hypothetical protein
MRVHIKLETKWVRIDLDGKGAQRRLRAKSLGSAVVDILGGGFDH